MIPDASAFSVDVGGSRNVTGVAISGKKGCTQHQWCSNR
ncbi:MAG: hypothetical protein Rpha_1090 [Candidatus Ruthia sp. Apha_13_S6]|nr:hypothetical protein [Candidatus Ruthia sp. Apha_13_S6]